MKIKLFLIIFIKNDDMLFAHIYTCILQTGIDSTKMPLIQIYYL